MRVLVEHRDGRRDEPIDVGALWDTGKAPESKAGDWWLILPVAPPTDPPPDTGSPKDPTGGKVTNDLIDTDGNRVIELGTLTVRVGPDTLAKTGSRPEPADDMHLSIEHPKSKSKITIKDDGAITIEAAETLQLTGKKGITIDAAGEKVTINAADVEVNVDNAMEVK